MEVGFFCSLSFIKLSPKYKKKMVNDMNCNVTNEKFFIINAFFPNLKIFIKGKNRKKMNDLTFSFIISSLSEILIISIFAKRNN